MTDFSQEEVDHFRYFVLPLGAKRILDFAGFFEKRNLELAKLKNEQAKLFDKSHSMVTIKN